MAAIPAEAILSESCIGLRLGIAVDAAGKQRIEAAGCQRNNLPCKSAKQEAILVASISRDTMAFTASYQQLDTERATETSVELLRLCCKLRIC